MNPDKRTFNTPLREPLNPIIHRLLQAVDWHNARYFKDHNRWHLEKATIIRQYVTELKAWVYEEEAKALATLGEGVRTEGGDE